MNTTQVGKYYEDTMEYAIKYIIKDILGSGHTINVKNISQQKQIKPNGYKVDWVYEYDNKLILYECKFRNKRGCNEGEVGNFWRWCYTLQQNNSQIDIFGVFLTNTYYEHKAIDWTLSHPYSEGYDKHVRLYTVNKTVNQQYLILLKNFPGSLVRQQLIDIIIPPLELLSSNAPDKFSSIDTMIEFSLYHLRDAYLKQAPSAHYSITQIKLLEILTNALLHKNYINESIAFSAKIVEKLDVLLRQYQAKHHVINSILEIYAVYCSAIRIRRTQRNYSSAISVTDLKHMLNIINYYSDTTHVPNAIATLARLVALATAEKGNESKCLNMFDLSHRILSTQDNEYLNKTTKLTLAEINLGLRQESPIDKILSEVKTEIDKIPITRFKIMATQKYLRVLAKKYQILKLNNEYESTKEQLLQYQLANDVATLI